MFTTLFMILKHNKVKRRINNYNYSVRVCAVADAYGFKTVGVMLKALKRAKPNTKWHFNMSSVRGTSLIKEIECSIKI